MTLSPQRVRREYALAGKSPILGRYPGPDKVIAMKTPQQLSREAIDDFKAIYQDEFGKELSDDEVQEIAIRLLRFFGILRQPPLNNSSDQTDR